MFWHSFVLYDYQKKIKTVSGSKKYKTAVTKKEHNRIKNKISKILKDKDYETSIKQLVRKLNKKRIKNSYHRSKRNPGKQFQKGKEKNLQRCRILGFSAPPKKSFCSKKLFLIISEKTKPFNFKKLKS